MIKGLIGEPVKEVDPKSWHLSSHPGQYMVLLCFTMIRMILDVTDSLDQVLSSPPHRGCKPWRNWWAQIRGLKVRWGLLSQGRATTACWSPDWWSLRTPQDLQLCPTAEDNFWALRINKSGIHQCNLGIAWDPAMFPIENDDVPLFSHWKWWCSIVWPAKKLA